MIIGVTNQLVFDKRTREWCKMPYPGHPKGCPNYDTRDTCPPRAPMVYDYFDLSKPHWFAIVRFDLATYAAGLKEKHPDWSDKKCRCCRYWQNTPRKELREIAGPFINKMNFKSNFSEIDNDLFGFHLIPEAMGVNVFRTCRRIGISLRKTPKEIVHKVALIGVIKE